MRNYKLNDAIYVVWEEGKPYVNDIEHNKLWFASKWATGSIEITVTETQGGIWMRRLWPLLKRVAFCSPSDFVRCRIYKQRVAFLGNVASSAFGERGFRWQVQNSRQGVQNRLPKQEAAVGLQNWTK